MTTPLSARREILLSIVFILLLVFLAGGMGVYVLSDTTLREASLLAATAIRVAELYDGDIDRARLVDNAREAMLARLDRYSGYINKAGYSQMDEEWHGSYGGIGVSVVPHEDGLLIMSVRETGPAAEVGLLTGDIIIRADSVWFPGRSADQTTEVLRGPEGTTVSIGVIRPSEKDTLEFVVERRKIDLLHIPFAGLTPDSMLYIRLLDFSSGAADDLAEALDSLLQKSEANPSGTEPRGLILDLRGNPGGLLNEAYDIANLFLDKGQLIVGTAGRSRWETRTLESSDDDATGGMPMVVLVDRGSASAAEIVSGALHQLGRATLVGDTTFGKGLVQGFSRFEDGSGLRLTVARYFLAGNLYLNELDSMLHDVGHGLVPDIHVDFVETKEFPGTLERSLLLETFAHRHQDEILTAPLEFALPIDWTDRFAAFAASEGFVFVSLRTDQAAALVDVAHLEDHPPTVTEAAQKLLLLSQQADMGQFEQYSEYIRSRLRQIALERKYSLYRAYHDEIVRTRPDIRLAAEVIREKSR
jgi:carboxyl-terminal processing protease